eukprot:299438_1
MNGNSPDGLMTTIPPIDLVAYSSTDIEEKQSEDEFWAIIYIVGGIILVWLLAVCFIIIRKLRKHSIGHHVKLRNISSISMGSRSHRYVQHNTPQDMDNIVDFNDVAPESPKPNNSNVIEENVTVTHNEKEKHQDNYPQKSQ